MVSLPYGLMVRGLSWRPNLTEGPAATRHPWRSLKEEEEEEYFPRFYSTILRFLWALHLGRSFASELGWRFRRVRSRPRGGSAAWTRKAAASAETETNRKFCQISLKKQKTFPFQSDHFWCILLFQASLRRDSNYTHLARKNDHLEPILRLFNLQQLQRCSRL
jgi:hypothetical protein